MKERRQTDHLINEEQGIALILVLLVISALVVLVLDLNYTTRVNLRLAENFRDDAKAYFLARGAVEAAVYWLKEDTSDYDALCEPGDLSCENEWSLDNPGMEVGDGVVELKIRDEDGKIWINNTGNYGLFDQASNKSTKDFRDRLEKELFLDDEVFDSIQDWIDSGDIALPDGAEADDYESLELNYKPRNGPFLDLSELLMVKGITDRIYYGKDEDYPVGLKDIFTTFGDSTTAINVNTAPPEVLTALALGIDGNQVADDRIDAPFEDVQTFKNYLASAFGINKTDYAYNVKSTYFSVYIRVRVHNVTKFAHAVLQRKGTGANMTISMVYWREE